MGEIVIFFTGGTITMRPQAKKRGVVPGDDFQRFLGELRPHLPGVGLTPVRWSNLPSPHMTPEDMFRLARDVDDALAATEVLGAVVIHGTDVLVESAFMADLTVHSTKPVIYTGSMRYYSETGYDGLRNLLNSIKACLLPLPPESGVVLLMTDRLFAARDVVKINSMNIDAFEAPESGPLALVAGDQVVLTRKRASGGVTARATITTEGIENRVGLVACYTGMDGALIDHLGETGVKGLVVEGFGAGNVPPKAVPAIERAVSARIPVVLTTQCPEGGVWPIYAYPGGGEDLRSKGIIHGGRLSGAKARILLMVALGAGLDLGDIRGLF